MSTLRFVLRTDKPDKFGKCPIELIYQISGQRKKIFTDIKLHPVSPPDAGQWDIKRQKAVYIKPDLLRKIKRMQPGVSWDDIILMDSEVNEINSKLASIQAEIINIEKLFELTKEIYSAESVIEKYKAQKTGTTERTEHKEFLFDFIDRYIVDNSASRAPGSLTVYKSVKNHLLNYQAATKEKIRFEKLDYGFFQRFQNFLIGCTKTDANGNVSPMLNNTTIAKALSTLKTLIGYARKHGIKINEGYRDFSIKKEKLEVITLTQDEFNRLLQKDYSDNKKFDRVRDLFCFSCATGLRVSDLEQLKREHIKGDEIRLTVKKTKRELTIPLNKISAGILDKYRELDRPLPLISSQKLNEYIKDVCQDAEINEPIEIVRFKGPKREAITYPKYQLIHIHTGRKTFVTLSLEKGMSAEQVMAITGHTDYASFKRYVDVTKKLTKVVMVKAWGEVPKLKVV